MPCITHFLFWSDFSKEKNWENSALSIDLKKSKEDKCGVSDRKILILNNCSLGYFPDTT